jgi:hypothetical protein
MQRAHWIVTGANAQHFANSRMLVASWWDTNRQIPLAVCDFGLTSDQLEEVRSWPVTLLALPRALDAETHGWRRKAGLNQYVHTLSWRTLTWVDADAVILESLADVESLIEGYDLLIDAHRMAIGEILCDPTTTAQLLPLDRRDAYFSSGFWSTRSQVLLDTWDTLCAKVVGF